MPFSHGVIQRKQVEFLNYKEGRAVGVVGGLLYRADVRETFMNLKILTLPFLFILLVLWYM